MFTKPNAIVYVRRNGLIVAGRRIKPARLNFPPELVTNLEIQHSDKFVSGCQAFFNDHAIKGARVLMVLDYALVFRKTVDLEPDEQPGTITDAFIAAMPFDSGKRACLSVRNEATLELYATNADFYESVTEALDQAGAARLLAITPAAAYNLAPEDQKLGAAIEYFIADTKVRGFADFKSVSPM